MQGTNIKAMRLKRGMSQQELADAIGVTKSTISKYEKGQREPKYNVLRKIAATLGVDWTDLVPADEQCEIITKHIVEKAGLTVKDEDGNILRQGDGAPREKAMFPSRDLRANHKLITFNATPDPEWELLYHKIEDGTANNEERQAFAKLFQDSLIKSNLAIEKITDKLSEIINCMTVLNEDGQQRVLMFAADLAEIPKYRKSTQIRETAENVNASSFIDGPNK